MRESESFWQSAKQVGEKSRRGDIYFAERGVGSNSNRGKVRICGKAEIFEGKRTKCERIGKGKKSA